MQKLLEIDSQAMQCSGGKFEYHLFAISEQQTDWPQLWSKLMNTPVTWHFKMLSIYLPGFNSFSAVKILTILGKS